MVRSNGKRANTRHLFKKSFRKKGPEHVSTYLQTFHVGDFVDIHINPAVMKGMPHKFYQGRTGRIFNVSRTAVGVEVSKQVGNQILMKRFHIRIEHINKSRCSEDFRKRVLQREQDARGARERGEKYVVQKRTPVLPPNAHVVDATTMELVEPIPYEFVV
ncbi:60S ribosomal protein L21-2 [Gracilariopsis chorda]|uniref:60S ribosomal protein L21-2 n=1 Tax=Gracilariopsis chorda TaxID=448386 RepID=A0A2V3IK50_9FLOR|nr:60S ribosomal protein L21-2 [Gracilariopsis chorda]|eukprot:PXF42447.1 60S ribosomal protein L21-2 [Gracilariopsis chorda]